MSTKVFNKTTQQWETVGSNMAGTVKVLDAEGNYVTDDHNVEACLKELKHDIKTLDDRVEYIYENGTIGGGGGGGGSSMPTVKLDSPSEIVVSSDEIIDIYFFFNSPNVGNGTAVCSINNKTEQFECKQGKNKWTVGPFSKGKYTLDIYVQDIAGLFSNPVTVSVVSGALELSTSFNDGEDIAISQEITIDYDISSLSPIEVWVDQTLDGNTKTVAGKLGINQWNIGRLGSTGVHKASIVAYNEEAGLRSNELKFNLVVSATDKLFMSSTFDTTQIEVGKKILIDFRLSMQGYSRFLTDLYINGSLFNTINSRTGLNYWDVGDALDPGTYTFKLISRTPPAVEGGESEFVSNELEFVVEVVAGDYVPFKMVERGLLAAYDSAGKLNTALDKNVWKDVRGEGHGFPCQLYKFNYGSNGWLEDGLTFNGQTYAIIDYAPFSADVQNGFTFDILYKVTNVGNIDAKVVSCINPVTPYQGFTIDTMQAEFNSSRGKKVISRFQESYWEHQTFVVDRNRKFMQIYTNGIMTNVVKIDSTEPYTYGGKIILGAGINEEGAIVNNSSCVIKTVRIYGTALTSEEVLQNYIADIRDKESQLAIRDLNYGDNDLPVLTLTGDENGMTDLNEVFLDCVYVDRADPTKSFGPFQTAVSWQGTSSLQYPIKNYTLRFIREEDWEQLDGKPKTGWLPEPRYTLKANFMESSQANNVAICNFAREVMKEKPYPSEIKNPKTRMTVDGTPIRLVINGDPKGVYMFNIDRYAHRNYGLFGEKQAVSYEIGVNSINGAGAFANTSWESIRSEFNHRFNYRGDENFVTEWVMINNKETQVLKAGYHQELIDMITWVANATDQIFLSEFEEHFSKGHCIDYFLIVYAMGLVDSLGKNSVWTTWGRDSNGYTIWYPSFYDADTSLSLNNEGHITYEPSVDMIFGNYNTSESRLWTRMQKLFATEIADRYRQLRLKEFTPEFIIKFIENDVVGKIAQRHYNEDADIKYLNRTEAAAATWLYQANGSRLEHTKRWLKERFEYLDTMYNYGNHKKSVIIRSNDITGHVELRLKTYSPVWIEVAWSDQAGSTVRKLVSKDQWYTIEGELSNIRDNNIYITGAPNLMYIDGIKELSPSGLSIGDASRLCEVNCANSPYLKRVAFENNPYMQRIDLHGCPQLGQEAVNSSIDISSCINLKYLDISDTKLSGCVFNQDGGVLETLNMSKTNIVDVTLRNQEYLPAINLNQCRDLSTFDVRGCNSLTRVEMPNSKLKTFIVEDCAKMDTLDISYTGYLASLNLAGCPKLRVLKMSGCSNPAITELDLTYCQNIQYLDVSKCDNLAGVRFATGCNTLKTFLANDSGIRYFRYGLNNPPAYLDLGGHSLTSINFSNCPYVAEVRNINFTGGGAIFYNCRELTKITGSMTLKGSCYHAFYHCEKLGTLPGSFDLSGVTSISECFEGCYEFNLDHLELICSKLSSCTDWYRGFANCSGIIVDDLHPLKGSIFDNCRAMSSLYWTFLGTGIKGQLPLGIFKNQTNLVTFRRPFESRRLTGYLPPGIFENCANLADVQEGFQDQNFEIAPDYTLFENCPKLHTCNHMFSGNNKMVGVIDPELFANNPMLQKVNHFFNGCTGLVGTIPQTLFMNNPQLRQIQAFFNGCTGLTGEIPDDLINNNSLLTDISSLFGNCTGLTGAFPKNFIRNNPNLVSINSLFSGCTGIGGQPGDSQEIPTDFFANQRNLSDIGWAFNKCQLLNFHLSTDFFKDLVSVKKISGLFSQCYGLSGEIPEKFFTCYDTDGETEVPTVINEAKQVFYMCRNLTGQIPADLFDKFLQVTDLSNFFSGNLREYSNRLEGKIPENLFAKCFNLINASSMFYRCLSLGNPNVSEDDPYALDPNLFKNCAKLESTNSMFSECDSLRGELPETLFQTCANLKNTDHMFYSTPISGTLSGNLFKNNKKLERVPGMFRSCGQLTGIEPTLFTDTNNPLITSFQYTFWGCSKMTGTAPQLWITHPSAERGQCFQGCTSLTNWAEIPDTWK